MKSKGIVKDDSAIIQEILNGNSDVFESLVLKYQTNIRFSVKKMIRDYDDIDDLVQEIFIKAFIGLDKYNPEYPFLAWLYRIASNHCIDFLRKKRLLSISIDKPINKDENVYVQIRDTEPSPDSSLLTTEKHLALTKALNELPDKYRKIIIMRHFDELEYQDIAAQLQLPLGTVKIHLFRARKALNELLINKKHLFEE